jgi:hypothetical protein
VPLDARRENPLVGKQILQQYTSMRSDLAARDGPFIEQLDQVGTRDGETARPVVPFENVGDDL